MIWLVGDSGMLGTDLGNAMKTRRLKYIASSRDYDVTKIQCLREFSSGKQIDWIINCSAFTAVDKAEDEVEQAFQVNAQGAENLGRLSRELGAGIVHISTDYVFSGTWNKPYLETDFTEPLSVYGRSKLAGEVAVVAANPKHFILRTAWLYGQFGGNFVYTMAKALRVRSELKVVNDQWGAPTWTADLVECILHLIQSPNPKYGLYNASGEGQITWFDFTLKIQHFLDEMGLLERKIPVIPIPTVAYPTRAPRPGWSVLSKEKLRKDAKFEFPLWDVSLKKFMSTLPKEKWAISNT